jgi:putative transcriptional regulator
MTHPDDDFSDVDAELLLAAVEPVAPTGGVRAALLRALAGPWFEPFVRRVAALCDVSIDAARGLLVAVDDAGRWMTGPGPGTEAFHIEAGPSLDGAIVGFIRLAPGALFPDHTHIGAEDVLVLQGSFVVDGRVVAAGEEAPMAAGTHHLLHAGPEGCLYLGVVRDGLDFGNGPIDPNDPRF